LHEQFRNAGDYAEFVRSIHGLATDGNAEAQYLTAKALKWCGTALGLYFRGATGQTPLATVQEKWALHQNGITRQELATIYTRCKAFLDDPASLSSGGSWQQWLDKAAAAGYPAAEAQKAADIESSILIHSRCQGIKIPVERRMRLVSSPSRRPLQEIPRRSS
jgi:hypothetical protein